MTLDNDLSMAAAECGSAEGQRGMCVGNDTFNWEEADTLKGFDCFYFAFPSVRADMKL